MKTALKPEARHPIAVVADRTGLSQDVLRVWERRYDAVRPQRGPGGQRLYTDADIERLILLQAATSAGRSIGQIAALPLRALAKLVEEDTAARERRSSALPAAPPAADLVETALALTRSLDGMQLDAMLRRAAARLGVIAFVETVAAPLLRAIGDEWFAGRVIPAHEHLASSIIYDIVADTMRTLPPRPGASRVLVATPAGERHAIGAALAATVAAGEGWQVVYLGADLPAADIVSAAAAADAQLVALSVVYVDDRARVLGELRAIRDKLPREVRLVVGGAGARSIATTLASRGVRVRLSLTDWLDELRRSASHDHSGDQGRA